MRDGIHAAQSGHRTGRAEPAGRLPGDEEVRARALPQRPAAYSDYDCLNHATAQKLADWLASLVSAGLAESPAPRLATQISAPSP